MSSAVCVSENSGGCVLYELESVNGGGAEGGIETVTVVKAGRDKSMNDFF